MKGRRSLLLVLIAVILAAPLFMSIGVGSAHAEDKNCAAGSDNKDCGKYSLYKLSSTMTNFFSNQNSPDKLKDHKLKKAGYDVILKRPGDAGSVLGYADPSFSLSLSWLTSELSGSSDAVGYGSLTAHDEDGKATHEFDGLASYAHFGAANRDLGLDNTSAGMTSGLIHKFAGGVVWLLYAISAGIPLLFGLVLSILKAINPFRWFYVAIYAISPNLANGMTGGQKATGPFSGLANWIGEWYPILMSISWTIVVPTSIALFVLGCFFFKKGSQKFDRGSKLKRIIVRMVFIGLGLPLLGGSYTSTLNAMADAVSGDNSGATSMVLSTYVDFQSWAMNDRLRIPDGASISWDADAGHALPKSQIRVRNTALLINKQAHPNAYVNIHGSTDESNPYKSWSQYNSSGCGGSGGASTAIIVIPVDGGGSCDSTGGANAFFTTLGMLTEYMSSDTADASAFETQAKSSLMSYASKKQAGDGDKTNADWVDGWFKQSQTSDDSEPGKNPVIATSGQGLTSSHPGGPKETFSSGTAGAGTCRTKIANDAGKPVNCNMSVLALYNYLNTSFGTNSMVMYSSQKATSGFTREQHSAVSQVGTGPAGFMYWVNCCAILLAIILVGFWYAFGMLFGAMKRTFEGIGAIPLALLGSISGIAKVIVYVTAMIMEVILTIFLYVFVSKMLTSMPQIVEGPLTTATKGSSILGNPLIGSILVVLLTFFSLVLVMIFTVVAMKVRKGVLKAVEEAVNKLIEKFLDTGVTPPGGGGGTPGSPGGGVGSGLGAGAGMAAAGAMMGRGAPASGAGGGGGQAAGPKTPNAGGTHGTGGFAGLPAGRGGGSGGPQGSAGGTSSPGGEPDGPGGDGSGPGPDGAPGAGVGGAPGQAASGDGQPGDAGSGMLAGTSGANASDKDVAAGVATQGRLSRLGSMAKSPTGRNAAMGAMAGMRGGGGLKGAAAGAAGGVAAHKAGQKVSQKMSGRGKPSGSPTGGSATTRATGRPTSRPVRGGQGSSASRQASRASTPNAPKEGRVAHHPGGQTPPPRHQPAASQPQTSQAPAQPPVQHSSARPTRPAPGTARGVDQQPPAPVRRPRRRPPTGDGQQ